MGRTDAGAVYVFVRSGGTWTQQAKIVAADGRSGDNFGARVSLSGDTLVIGAPGSDPFGRSNAGAAYVYQRFGTTWYPSGKLVASDAAADDQLGFSVAVDGDNVVAGARSADVGMRKDAGAAYVFSRRGMMWFQTAKLAASDGAANDSFGVGVAISGDYVLVGSDFAEIAGKTDAGAAYVYQRGAMGYVQQAKLVAADGAAVVDAGRLRLPVPIVAASDFLAVLVADPLDRLHRDRRPRQRAPLHPSSSPVAVQQPLDATIAAR